MHLVNACQRQSGNTSPKRLCEENQWKDVCSKSIVTHESEVAPRIYHRHRCEIPLHRRNVVVALGMYHDSVITRAPTLRQCACRNRIPSNQDLESRNERFFPWRRSDSRCPPDGSAQMGSWTSELFRRGYRSQLSPTKPHTVPLRHFLPWHISTVQCLR